MATRVSDVLLGTLGELRYQPLGRRLRAHLDTTLVLDSLGSAVVWEPQRLLPTYAVPRDDVAADLLPTRARTAEVPHHPIPGPGGVVFYGSQTPFAFHTCPGTELSVRAGDDVREAAAFAPDDATLADYVIMKFSAFDWLEEDEPVTVHPRDPFSRIDVLSSSRRLVFRHDSHVIAETDRALVLYEGVVLPPRYYFPAEDVRVELRPSQTRTVCPYKGQASHWSAVVGDEELRDLFWSYPQAKPEVARVAGLLAPFTERLDVEVDGVPQERPVTAWS